MRNETPDSWIERRPEDSLPDDPADCCPVCGAYDDCYCADNDEKIAEEGTRLHEYIAEEKSFDELADDLLKGVLKAFPELADEK
jgi:hypothetical protein